jgi:hypothetical protein
MPAEPRSVRGCGLVVTSVLILLSQPALAWGSGDVGDKAADPDGDKLDNLAEFGEGTDPLDPDTDGGGCWDGWEVSHGLDPTDPDDDALDADRDGWSNLREFQEGTNPRDANTDRDSYLVDSHDPHPLTPDDNHGLAPGAVWTGAGTGWADTGPSNMMGQGQTSGQGEGRSRGQGNGQGRSEGPWQQREYGRGLGDPGRSDGNRDSDLDGLVEFLDLLP